MPPLRPHPLGLPVPSTWEMVRRFRSVREDRLSFLEDVQRRYGDTVAIPVPHRGWATARTSPGVASELTWVSQRFLRGAA